MNRREANPRFPNFQTSKERARQQEAQRVARAREIQENTRSQLKGVYRVLRDGLPLLQNDGEHALQPLETKRFPWGTRLHAVWELDTHTIPGGDGSSWSQNYPDRTFTFVMSEEGRIGWVGRDPRLRMLSQHTVNLCFSSLPLSPGAIQSSIAEIIGYRIYDDLA